MLSRAFENAATATAKQGVPTEQAACAIICEVTQRMPGHGEDGEAAVTAGRLDRLTTAQRPVDAADRFCCRPEYLGTMVCQQLGNAALVVGMVVRDEDAGESQPLALEDLEHRACVAWIDHRCRSAFAQQPDVVILEGWDTDDVKHR